MHGHAVNKISQDVSYSHPEFEILKPLKAVEVGYGEEGSYTLTVASSGEVQTVDNDFIRTQTDAQRVAPLPMYIPGLFLTASKPSNICI